MQQQFLCLYKVYHRSVRFVAYKIWNPASDMQLLNIKEQFFYAIPPKYSYCCLVYQLLAEGPSSWSLRLVRQKFIILILIKFGFCMYFYVMKIIYIPLISVFLHNQNYVTNNIFKESTIVMYSYLIRIISSLSIPVCIFT